jgi:cyanophycinase-like exopeptidase
MKKLYLIGGEDTRTDAPHPAHERVFEDNPHVSVLVFLWTVSDLGKARSFGPLLDQYFRGLGASRVEFVDAETSDADLLASVAKTELLYLPGGDPRVLLSAIQHRRCRHLFHDFDGAIAGNSAGSMAMASNALYLTGQDGEIAPGVLHGIGIADVSVSVHYGTRRGGTNADAELISLSREGRKVFAIPENSVLILDDGEIRPQGPVAVFADGKITWLGT